MKDMVKELLEIYKEQKEDAYYLTYVVPSYNTKLNSALHSSCEMLIESMFVKEEGLIYKYKEAILDYVKKSSVVSAKVFYHDLYLAFYNLSKDKETVNNIIETLAKGTSIISEEPKNILAKVLIMNLIIGS